MAKASIARPDGTKIQIDGSPEEVAQLVRLIEGESSLKTARVRQPGRQAATAKASLPDMLVSLAHDGFFKKPKDLTAVKGALAELGEVYPASTIAPALLRLVRRRRLRRIRQDKRWYYNG